MITDKREEAIITMRASARELLKLANTLDARHPIGNPELARQTLHPHPGPSTPTDPSPQRRHPVDRLGPSRRADIPKNQNARNTRKTGIAVNHRRHPK